MRLVSNSTQAIADLTSYGNEVEFTAPGINVGSTNSGYEEEVNKSGVNYVGWNWKAGGTAASNTDGTITSSVSANPTAGFSIVSYTGTGSAATIGHGLSSAPEMVIVKNLDDGAESWVVSVGNATGTASEYLVLNSNIASQTDTSQFPSAPNSSVVSIGATANVNVSTEDFIAYCFSSIEGYSKVGSFAGNSDVDGPFIFTGFKPAYAIFKRTGSSADWVVFDNKRNPYNAVDTRLYPNTNAMESTAGTGYADMDFVSNGIKIRGDSAMYNNSSGPYIFYAVAESPFKTSNAT